MLATQTEFKVPERSEVSEKNQVIFDQLEQKLGFVPNLYAYYAKNDTALSDYLHLNSRKSTLSNKEKEIVNLVTSQINGCEYCLSAHTAIAKMNGFTDDQIIEIRSGKSTGNEKFDALTSFTSAVVNNQGSVNEADKDAFFEAGYDESNMLDVVILIGDKTISNYIHNLAKFEIDFPIAPSI
ncbi:MAG: carboxymuconolactone decarboxylase family protein [Bacteroidia bacterium]|nr:carboxymuconolactone decarboxylase family protein [Bacteroidia bacterium]MBT8228681.1 carboxymuconolactone decarboxylase family protein [Bacteroidia bacterium]NNK90293.1 carboxymuconolactone decarboxylase family protein [Saprospiraceae bacterium]